MAVRIYSNPLSVQAQNSLGGVKNAMTKSIERISSGRRLNSASDDASGFAVSQKLKSQITGLAMANRNSQDGVSYLQTAEGGLDIMGQMVGRMRELAVQASNGVYTTTDRAELQKEVDQLKQEVDRVSNSTEFNTKKLLNGESTALTSTESSKIKTNVNGEVEEGSYEVRVQSKAGNAEVYQSAIFRTNSDEFNAYIGSDTKSSAKASVFMVGTDKDLIGSMNFATTSASYSMKVATAAAIAGGTAYSTGIYMGNGSTFSSTAIGHVTVSAGMSTGYVEIRVTKWDAAGINALENKATSGKGSLTKISVASTITAAFKSGLAKIEVRFHDARTGADSGWHSANVAAVGKGIAISAKVSAKDANGFAINFSMSSLGTDTANFSLQVGDAWGLAVQGKEAATDLSKGSFTLSVSGGADGHKVADRKVDAGAKALQISFGAGELSKRNNSDEVTDYGRARIYMGSLDRNDGTFHFGAMDVYVKENSSTTSNIIKGGTFHIGVQGGGSAASVSTKLNQLANFVTSDGRHIFDGNNSSELSVYSAEGKKASVTLVGSDTLQDVDNKLTSALVRVGLGASLEIASTVGTVSRINNSLVTFAGPNGGSPDRAPSTFRMQAARVGSASKFSIVGEEAVVNGFGMNTAQAGHDSALIVTARNISTGKSYGTENVLDGVYRGVANLDLKIDGATGSKAVLNEKTSTVGFKSNGGTDVYHFSVQNNATKLQIGANEGQNFDISVPQLNADSMGISDAFVFSQEHAQKAITKFDDAIKRIASVRATIGAQINRLNFTSTNVGTMRQNLVASNSRIEDADIAEETSQYQRNQVLNQAATSMLAQANGQTQSALSLLQ